MKTIPRPLLAVVGPTCLAGVAALAWAFASLALGPLDTVQLIGIAALLAASTLAERFPVPLEGVDAGGVSLSFVFGIAAIVLFGWEAGVIVCFAAPAIMQLVEHRPPIRVVYNASVFAIAAAVTGAAVAAVPGDGAGALVARIALAGLVQYGVNMALVTAVVSVSSRRPLHALLASNVRSTALPFALMTSTALALVVLWERAEILSLALFGPLLAIGLYQRSSYHALRAMRLALTDPLTGLGNHRHFHERLGHELERAERKNEDLTICLLDVDDFKRINDRFGHPAGDRLLKHVAGSFRQNGETFRLGGDEFAILLPGRGEAEASAVAAAVLERLAGQEFEQAGSITVSAGVATFPVHATTSDELVRLADGALYWAKEHGKNQVRVYRAAIVELAELRRLADVRDRAAHFRAAASLSRAVDARDTYTGTHSERVAELAARIAVRLDLDEEHVELIRLAGSLHDLGKLAIPEHLLRKPGPLTPEERTTLQRHPELGFRMLESLGVDPVSTWVLHHHEHWDGSGYPDRLAGDAIPLGARILLAADAYDAITSERCYGPGVAAEEALAELKRCSGTQFDPQVVVALAAEIETGEPPVELVALAS
ncbi:MAG: HD domain-containing phosphohydrolase [Gaiellaceae bacterium]